MQGHHYNAPFVKGETTLFAWHRCRRVRGGELEKSTIIKQIGRDGDAHTFVACLDRICEMASVNLRAQRCEESLYPVSERDVLLG